MLRCLIAAAVLFSVPGLALAHEQTARICGKNITLFNVKYPRPDGQTDLGQITRMFARAMKEDGNEENLLICTQKGRTYLVTPGASGPTAWMFYL